MVNAFPVRLTPAISGLAVAGASIAVLGAALLSQYLGGLQPCELCHWQRYPYVATAVLGASAAALAYMGGSVRGVGLLIALAGLAFAVGAGIAVYHVGVEQRWWEGAAACGGPVFSATDVESLRRAIMARPVVRCDEVAWSLFGVSMAGYNALVSGALAFGALAAARRLWRDDDR
jgi:disulfide bond formation protein DsbB